jgi:hypothetical protein
MNKNKNKIKSHKHFETYFVILTSKKSIGFE